MTTTATDILSATRQVRNRVTSMADRLQALVEYIGSADFDPRSDEESDEAAGLIDELDSMAEETKSELTRGAKALDMLFELFPGATDPAVSDEEEDEDEEVEGSYAALKRARDTLRARGTEIDLATPASGKRTRRARK